MKPKILLSRNFTAFMIPTNFSALRVCVLYSDPVAFTHFQLMACENIANQMLKPTQTWIHVASNPITVYYVYLLFLAWRSVERRVLIKQIAQPTWGCGWNRNDDDIPKACLLAGERPSPISHADWGDLLQCDVRWHATTVKVGYIWVVYWWDIGRVVPLC